MKKLLAVLTFFTVSHAWAQDKDNDTFTISSITCYNGNAIKEVQELTTADPQKVSYSVSKDGKKLLLKRTTQTSASEQTIETFSTTKIGTVIGTLNDNNSFLAYSSDSTSDFIVEISPDDKPVVIYDRDRNEVHCGGGLIVITLIKSDLISIAADSVAL